MAVTTTTPVALLYEAGDDIADIEAVDPVIVSDRLEQVDIGGGILGSNYLRLTAPDLVVQADELKKLADRIIDTVMDARQDRIEAEAKRCFCGALLDEDESTCGALRCEKEWAHG